MGRLPKLFDPLLDNLFSHLVQGGMTCGQQANLHSFSIR